MEMYKNNDTVMISVRNLPKFNKLLSEAEEKANELNKIISELAWFHLEVSFSAESGEQTGKMDEASSTRSSIDT